MFNTHHRTGALQVNQNRIRSKQAIKGGLGAANYGYPISSLFLELCNHDRALMVILLHCTTTAIVGRPVTSERHPRIRQLLAYCS